ncbi:MAG TPA: diguanylate cyclase [Bacillales bacterium]|nr:diguanylate cyclase [Bacillales bacterium]
MNVENAFRTVLDTNMIEGPAVFILFDETQKPVVIQEQGDAADVLKTVVLEIDGFVQLQQAMTTIGGLFKAVPVVGLPWDGHLGAVFLKKNMDMERMTERLLELLGMIKHAVRADDRTDRYRLLYQVTKKFHSSMDVRDVLREILLALNTFYPSFQCRLYLSHESGEDMDLPIESLEYGKKTTDEMAARAYMSGDFQTCVDPGKRTVLYAPLRGKQGVYGVLQITAPGPTGVPEQDVELIELLADTGGNALENAQLYQQSQQFISDLQLINKTSHELNANLRLSDTIRLMTDQIIRSFHAEEVGFIHFRAYGETEVLEGSTNYFFEKQSRPMINFMCERIKSGRDSLFIGDLDREMLPISSSYRSIIGIPMIQDQQMQGMVIVLHHAPYHFSFGEFKLLQSLVRHSTLAFTNSILHEKLQQMVITDYLTGLFVRHYLDEQIQLSMETDGFGCFILLDIDDFKIINDTHGHQTGDEILVQVAGIIRQNIRKVDIAARWGGEELAVYLPTVNCQLGHQISKRLVNKINNGTAPKTTVSCGISYWNSDTVDKSMKALFSRADRALYRAKQSGKNQVMLQDELPARNVSS